MMPFFLPRQGLIVWASPKRMAMPSAFFPLRNFFLRRVRGLSLERAVLRLLGADCSAPVAAFAEMEGEVIRLRAMYGEGYAEGKAPVAARLQLAAEVVRRLRK